MNVDLVVRYLIQHRQKVGRRHQPLVIPQALNFQDRRIHAQPVVPDILMRAQPDPTTLAGTAGILPYGQDMDAAADTLALYMLVRAGYSIENAPSFWQRLATQYPASVPNGYTAIHPSTTYRLAMIGKVTQIINAKKAAGKPLLP